MNLEQRTGLPNKNILAIAIIGGLTALLASRNPKHALEIATGGAAAVALSLVVTR